MIEFTEEQLERYSRHIILADIGIEGQEKLLNGRVLIVGAGGLGSPAALYLAAAGVGYIGLIDGDVVDRTNLQRQVIHWTEDVGVAKVESAKKKMMAINPDISVQTYNQLLTTENARNIISDYDFIIDGTDNFAAKFLVNDACVLAGIPFSHGGILRFTGQTMTIFPGQSACYRCTFDAPPPANAVPTCSQAGVLGAIAGMLGTIQSCEAIKYLIKIGETLDNRLLSFDAKAMRFREVRLKRNRRCRICGDEPEIVKLSPDRYLPAPCDLKPNQGAV